MTALDGLNLSSTPSPKSNTMSAIIPNPIAKIGNNSANQSLSNLTSLSKTVFNKITSRTSTNPCDSCDICYKPASLKTPLELTPFLMPQESDSRKKREEEKKELEDAISIERHANGGDLSNQMNSASNSLKKLAGKLDSPKELNTCTDCLEFFKRALNENYPRVYKCPNLYSVLNNDPENLAITGEGYCEITPDNIHSGCKLCRLKKCLKLGMSNSTIESHPILKERNYCSVCHDVTDKSAYGIPTCIPCANFFRRTVTENEYHNLKCVKNNNKCIINVETRKKSCTKCRFDKCATVGHEISKVGSTRKNTSAVKRRINNQNSGASGGSGKNVIDDSLPSLSFGDLGLPCFSKINGNVASSSNSGLNSVNINGSFLPTPTKKTKFSQNGIETGIGSESVSEEKDLREKLEIISDEENNPLNGHGFDKTLFNSLKNTLSQLTNQMSSNSKPSGTADEESLGLTLPTSLSSMSSMLQNVAKKCQNQNKALEEDIEMKEEVGVLVPKSTSVPKSRLLNNKANLNDLPSNPLISPLTSTLTSSLTNSLSNSLKNSFSNGKSAAFSLGQLAQHNNSSLSPDIGGKTEGQNLNMAQNLSQLASFSQINNTTQKKSSSNNLPQNIANNLLNSAGMQNQFQNILNWQQQQQAQQAQQAHTQQKIQQNTSTNNHPTNEQMKNACPTGKDDDSVTISKAEYEKLVKDSAKLKKLKEVLLDLC